MQHRTRIALVALLALGAVPNTQMEAQLGPPAPAGISATVVDRWRTDDVYAFTVQLRNNSAFTPGVLYGFNALQVGLFGSGVCSIDCTVSGGAESVRVVGSVDRSDLFLGGGVVPVRSDISAWGFASSGVTALRTYGPAFDNTGLDAGILGCSTPTAEFPDHFFSYSIGTCAQAGYDGWLELDLSFRFEAGNALGLSGLTVSQADFFVTPIVRAYLGPTASVPEPAMLWPLPVALLLARTKRRFPLYGLYKSDAPSGATGCERRPVHSALG